MIRNRNVRTRRSAVLTAFAASALQRRLIEKKWQYVSVATPDVILALCIVDAGYLATGFCAVFDRGGRRLLIDDNPVLVDGLGDDLCFGDEGLSPTATDQFFAWYGDESSIKPLPHAWQ